MIVTTLGGEASDSRKVCEILLCQSDLRLEIALGCNAVKVYPIFLHSVPGSRLVMQIHESG